MAQMPIQLVSGRAQSFVAPPSANAAPAAPNSGQTFDSGAITGGALRPGAIDQKTFRQRMAELNRADPPAGGFPRPVAVAPAPAKAAPGIPTLTPAQLAALGLDVSTLAPAAPAAAADASAATDPAATHPARIDPATTGAPAPADEAAPADDSAPLAAAEGAAPAETPGDPIPEEAPNGPMPGARLGADGVWELPRHPGKDERAWLQGMNAKWRLVENPESVKLFLGADGKFGFDDLLDIVNPLQHIPLVNIAYRVLTGDTIDGAAQLFGAIPFGPLSVASNMADLAFRSETGAGLAENGLAMIFGDDAATDEIATAAGQLAEAPQIRRGSNR